MSLRLLLFFTTPLIIIVLFCQTLYAQDLQNTQNAQNIKVTQENYSMLLSAAQKGDINAQYNLALAHYLGQRGYQKDYALAAYWFQKAAENGMTDAEFNVGVLYDKGHGVKQNFQQAIFWYTKAAEKGHAKAQFNLGQILFEGFGGPKDLNAALLWFQKSAELGESRAQYHLGIAYLEGKGIPKNESLALEWLQKSAAQGNQNAISCLTLLQNQSH